MDFFKLPHPNKGPYSKSSKPAIHGLVPEEKASSSASSNSSNSHHTISHSDTPARWSKENPPSPRALLKLIRGVCAFPDTPSDQAHDSDTPSDVSNPNIDNLGRLSLGLDFYDYYPHNNPDLSLKPFGLTECTLATQIILPLSLNAVPPPSKFYHPLLNLTRLYGDQTTTSIRTVALGRILLHEKPTYWVVVMEIQHGRVFALRSSNVACEELLLEEDEDRDTIDWKEIPPVQLPEFDGKSWQAVYLGTIAMLGVDWRATGAGVGIGYRALNVLRWDSVVVGI